MERGALSIDATPTISLPPSPPPPLFPPHTGWVVPAYPLAKGAEEHKVLRVVCREDFSPGLAASLARHVVEAVEKLEKQVARVGAAVRASGAWRAAVNRTHSLARASAKAKGAAVTGNGVDYVGRHGGAC